VIPIAASLLLNCLFDLWGYGKFEPYAGYRLFVPTMEAPMFQPQMHQGLLGLFFDRAYGILPTAPIYFVAFAGVWPVLRSRRVLALTLLAPAISTILFIAVNHWWYGGTTPPPSRYLVVALALLAPFAAPILSRAGAKVMLAILAAWSFVVAFQFTAFSDLRHTFWDSTNAGIVRLIHARTGIDLGLAFPTLLGATRQDYLVSAVWTAVIAGVILFVFWKDRSERKRLGLRNTARAMEMR
jgi:hypothetical protein